MIVFILVLVFIIAAAAISRIIYVHQKTLVNLDRTRSEIERLALVRSSLAKGNIDP